MQSITKSRTSDVIIDLLKQNTGASLGDSGYAYGRHWERNQVVDFAATPQVKLYVVTDDDRPVIKSPGRTLVPVSSVSATVSLYHYLLNFLEVTDQSEHYQRELEALGQTPEQEDQSWRVTMEAFVKRVHNSEDEYLFRGGEAQYSYNWDNHLSQDIQFIGFRGEDSRSYVVLQVHNGCDARGGLTSPYVFALQTSEDEDTFLMAQQDLDLVEQGEPYRNWTYEGGQWVYASQQEVKLSPSAAEQILATQLYQDQQTGKLYFLDSGSEVALFPVFE
jgi:hypothetical protein